MTDDSHLQPAIAAEYLALASLLDAAPAAHWDTQSMCEGWRVREVVAHLTMPARYSVEEFTTELRDCDFDFTKLSNRIASRDADLPTADLVANLRSDVLHHWTPPQGGYQEALNHVVVHGLDITVPLGAERTVPPSTAETVLDNLTTGGVHAFFDVAVAGRTLTATDLDWSYGSGPELRATAADLTLTLCGRQVPADRLAGAPL